MKGLLTVGVPLAFFALFGVSIWYVGARLHTLFGTTSRWPIQIGVAVAFIGALVAVGATPRSSSAAVGVVNVLGGYVFTFYLLVLLSLLCLHAVQLRWNPPMAWSAVAVLALAFAATGAGALWAESLMVTETEIRLPGLKHEVTVMQISDVHLGHHRGRAYLDKIVEETNRRRPDLVLITGDLVDSNAALEPGVLNPLSSLQAPAYFVGGNHEKYVDTARALELIAQHGVRVLHNEVVETHGLQLVGLDYMNADEDAFDMHPSDDTRTIRSVLPSLPLKRDLPSVLMHHSPVGTKYAAAAGISLMVSGHTHAGQVFPASLFAGLIFPFNSGLHRQGGAQVFVSQGAGTFLTRVRLGTSNELNILRLTPETRPVERSR
ncbi:MAG: metallophosphoesterase [Phycisphaerae bacterium]|jgi:hypothetical protein